MSEKKSLKKLFTNNAVNAAMGLISVNAPGQVLDNAINVSGYEVEEQSILRIQTSGDMFIAFSDIDNIGAVNAQTSPAVKLVGAGVHYVIVSGKFVRGSAAADRIELLKI